MGRYYRLSKKMTEDEQAEVLREIRELENVQAAELTADGSLMKVCTKEDLYPDIMYKVVNICSRAGHGLEISFERFAFEDKE